MNNVLRFSFCGLLVNFTDGSEMRGVCREHFASFNASCQPLAGYPDFHSCKAIGRRAPMICRSPYVGRFGRVRLIVEIDNLSLMFAALEY